ncbi:MAG: asparaginase [candidate division Zixibacteria bacterium]|nr:asparaginase [candidate division Zixibacteria bacterium]
MASAFVPTLEVTRGDVTESIHWSAAAVVDHTGRLVAHIGSPDLEIYSRSSLKPFQALPTVMRGFPDLFKLEKHHLALTCASHSGEDRHVQAAQEILDAIGATVDDLQCGGHVPLWYKYTDQAVPAVSEFTAIHNNCSGKHAGMLALAKILGAPFATYLDADSPVQTLIRARVAAMLALDEAHMQSGVDGCSVPNYIVPLQKLAYGFARLAASVGPKPPHDEECNSSCARIVTAMRDHPEMVSGEGRFDLDLARGTNGRMFSKAGGEAVECVGIPEKGWGIAVKIADGGSRAIGPTVVGILSQLGLLNPDELDALKSYVHPNLRNHRRIVIGTMRMVAQVERV